MKGKTRLQKSTDILQNSKATKWCYVNVDNEFEFMGKTFVIDESIEEYKVYKKAGEVDDFTNESYMEEILVVLDANNKIRFYNQNYDLVEKISVKSE